MTPDPLVLVVDDIPQNVRLLEAVLSPKGFRVATASSGEEALDVLSKEHPDIVLLDILMPGMDGYEVCRRIREDPGTAFLPVIMITASGEQEKIRAIESGADDFVNKPFDQAELLARVRSLVRVKRYHDTIQNQAAELARWNRELSSASRIRSSNWSAWVGCAVSSRPSWLTSSSAQAMNPSLTRTAGRSRWCAVTCVALLPSPKRLNPRMSGTSSGSITVPWATS